MIIISGEFKVKQEYKQELINMSLKLIPPSRKEAGCISYSFLEDQENLGNFLFFERWQNQEAIDTHFTKSYFQDFADRFPGMIEGQAKIEIHEIKSTRKL